MTHVETIAIHFVGYNLLHGASNEVSGSLKLIRDLSNQTGTTMTTWNQKITASTNQVALANAKYAEVVKANNALIVDAAHDQALAWVKVSEAQDALALSTTRLDAALAQQAIDFELIASRSYSVADRDDIIAASNDRVMAAFGERAIAQDRLAKSSLALAEADKKAGDVAVSTAAKEKAAADAIVAAEERKTAAIRGMIGQQIGYLQTASAAAMGVGTGFLVGTAIAAGGLAWAASKASEFTADVNILHTQARVAISDLPVLSAGMLDMAGAVGFSADALAKALYLIESVGGGSMTAAHALTELRAAAIGAAVGHADLTMTANALASVMAVYPEIVGGASAAMGELDAIVGQGKMTMEDLNGALRTGVLATLQSAKISLGDFGGALATMTDYGIPAVQAANSLRMAIYLMTAPTQASDKVLKEFGLTTAEVSSTTQEWTDKLAAAGIRHAQLADDLQKPGGIIIALQDLRAHLLAAGLDAEGQVEVIYKAFGGGKMGKAVVTLYENIAGGARASDDQLQKLGFTIAEIATLHDRLITKTALVNAQANLLGQNFQFLLANDPSQMWKNFIESVNALIVSLGQAFLPILVSVLRFITPIVTSITDWTATHKELTASIIGTVLALSTIFGTALILIGALGMVGAAIAGIAAAGEIVVPVVAILFGLMAGGAALVTAGVAVLSTVWGSMSTLWDSRVVPAAQRLWNTIQDIWTVIQIGIADVKPMFDAAFADFATTLTEHGGLWDNATQAFDNFTKDLLTFVKSRTFAELIADFAVSIPAAIKIALDGVILFGDAVQLTLTDLVTSAKVAADLVNRNYAQAALDAGMGGAEVVRLSKKMAADMVTNIADQAAMFDGQNQAMWDRVVQDTMNATQKIGDDGSMAYGNALEKIYASGDTVAIAQATVAQRNGEKIGKAQMDGIMAGINAEAPKVWSAADLAAEGITAHMQHHLGIYSPSKIMAEQVGKPVIQGVQMGLEQEFPALYRSFGAMVVNLTNQPQKEMESLPPSSTKQPSNVISNGKVDTSKLEELIAESNAILAAIRDSESGIDSFAAQRRIG